MRIADALFKELEKELTTIFFVAGGGAMYLVDALGRSNLTYVAALHEQGAGYMAIGYSMATKNLGACLVTSGPGSTNVLSACAAAWMDSIPILFISGQAKSTTLVGSSNMRTKGVQEVDIIPLVTPITKLAWQADGVESLLCMLERMIATCKDRRPGPCWLSIPLDVQGMEV